MKSLKIDYDLIAGDVIKDIDVRELSLRIASDKKEEVIIKEMRIEKLEIYYAVRPRVEAVRRMIEGVRNMKQLRSLSIRFGYINTTKIVESEIVEYNEIMRYIMSC